MIHKGSNDDLKSLSLTNDVKLAQIEEHQNVMAVFPSSIPTGGNVFG